MKTFDISVTLVRLAEFAAALSAFTQWNKWRGTPWRMFSFYLLFIVAAEAVGNYTLRHGFRIENRILFQGIVIPLEFVVAMRMFYLGGGDKTDRMLSHVFITLYVLAWLTDMVVIHYFDFRVHSSSYTFGSLLLLILILRFLIRLATTGAVLQFQNNILFWMSAAWLLYYLGTLPYYGLVSTMGAGHKQLFTAYFYVVQFLNLSMYVLIATGYLCGKPRSASS